MDIWIIIWVLHLHSNAFFCYDFISIFFIGFQYMIHDGKKKWIEQNYSKKFNQQIVMNF
jgi:hypothetical protein